MAQPQKFPFNIMDVAELLHLHIRRRQADSVYADCPICGDKRGKMNINFAKNLWRCNYCNEGGGMLSLYGKVYGISNSEAYREICDTLQNGLTAPEYTAKELPEQTAIEQSVLASPQEIHQTFSMLLELLTLTPQHRKHLREVRGLTDEQIERLGYKSTPPFYLCRSLAQKLRSRGCKVEGVPGFYVGKDDKWTVNFNSVTAGIIIPAKGIDGMIRGAQIRLDTPIRDQESDPDKSGTKYLWLSSASKKRGVSSGSPVHFVGDPFARVVYVTEGLLKADVAHFLMDRSFAATAGANNVNKLDMLFALLAANGTEVIIEAEDMDKYHNAAVSKGASKIYLMARSHGLECRRLTWDPNYKGIDDWQLAMRQKKEQRDVSQMNFRTRFVCGLCSFDAISEEIAAWHERNTGSSTLHDHLGLSEQEYYYHYKAGYDLTPWCNGYRPVFDRWKYNFTADMSGVLYQRNLSDTLKDTPWAYSQLEAFSGIASFSGVATFLSAYIKRPKIEHLIKMKLYRLVSGIIYGGYSYSALQAINFNGENMRAILGIDRPYFPLLRELDPSIDQLHLIRQLLQADHKPSTEQIKWFIASKITNADAAKELLAHMSVHKLQRYVEQQFAPEDEAALKRVDYYKMNTLITDYHDYLCMCKELQYDVKNSFILFPRELKAAHDSVAKTLKDKRTAEHEKAIAGSFDEWQKRYQYQSKELMMIPPHSAKEIVDEGAALHHCVRLYVKNVAEKKSVILFVRSVDEPDKSLCTVEVKDGQVTQARGFDNEEPPAQITAFIEQWKQRVLYASDKAAA